MLPFSIHKQKMFTIITLPPTKILHLNCKHTHIFCLNLGKLCVERVLNDNPEGVVQLVTDFLENSSWQIASKLSVRGGDTPLGHAHARRRLSLLCGMENGSRTNRASQVVTRSMFIDIILAEWEPSSASLFVRLELT